MVKSDRKGMGILASEAATHEIHKEVACTIEADRALRGLEDVDVSSCLKQLNDLSKKFRLTPKGKEALLNFATEWYLLGNTDLQYFMKDQVGITIDFEKHKPRYGGLKALYDEINPHHRIQFE